MRQLAFLTMRDTTGFMIYDRLLVEPLLHYGFAVTEIPWDAENVDWSRFEAVIIRSPWDYQQRPEAFMQALEVIETKTRLLNPLSNVRWNIHKRYLSDLEARGIAIVPTVFCSGYATTAVAEMANLSGKSVIKPAVSANADDTFVVLPNEPVASQISERLKGRDCLVQPFIPAIQTEGEFSVFFFGATCSHTILKTPADGDFRVQEEHGGRLQLIKHPDPSLLTTARNCWDACGSGLLYGRVDLVRHEGRWLLMEVELIEPSLYFNMDAESPERFARIVPAFLAGT